MFATRIDQENLTYDHQTAAAAKPLNQGSKPLGSKTPGNKAPKTPFRGNRNDENNTNFPGKTGLKTGKKGDEDIFTGANKSLAFNKNAFVTPAAPRNRAPLGMKTTNAKGNALQTPAPLSGGKEFAKSSQKPVSPRLRRAKVKIHQAEPVHPPLDDGEPDIEYMAPRSIPLPDHPDALHAFDFSIFKPENALPALWNAHANPVDEAGVSKSDRDYAKLMAETDKIQEAMIRAALAADPILSFDDPALQAPSIKHKPATRPDPVKKSVQVARSGAGVNSTRTPSSTSSRLAASALSKPAAPGPHFAAPTLAARARAPAPLMTAARSSATPSDSSNPRYAAATAASRSTLGYSKGRAVSASSRKSLSPAHQAEVVRRPAGSGLKPRHGLEYLMVDEPEVEAMLKRASARTEENGESEEREGEAKLDEALIGGVNGLDFGEVDDELAEFRLNVPEF